MMSSSILYSLLLVGGRVMGGGSTFTLVTPVESSFVVLLGGRFACLGRDSAPGGWLLRMARSFPSVLAASGTGISSTWKLWTVPLVMPGLATVEALEVLIARLDLNQHRLKNRRRHVTQGCSARKSD